MRSELQKRGLRFRKHVKELPGKPDIVFTKAKVVVFVDGDFWHGYLFSSWEEKISDFWKEKISKTRVRDMNNHQQLQDKGWTVIRLWQHEVKDNIDECVERVMSAIKCANRKEFDRRSVQEDLDVNGP